MKIKSVFAKHHKRYGAPRITNHSIFWNLECLKKHRLSKKPFILGFAAETENVIAHAIEKLHRKKMDMIVANDASNERCDESIFDYVR